VALAGAQKGAGFAETQWLVQRGSQFVQVSELLYRLLEQLDGERTLDKLAAKLTARSPWTISPEQVAQLLEHKLIPLGLVDSQAATAAARSKPRSPLAVNLRIKTIGPRLLEPITGVLQKLYAPTILIPLLALIVVAHAWLYLGRGVGDAVEQLLFHPMLVFAVIGVVLLSALLHEFGHASALRYGGGKVRAIGVGWYLIYPVFFTDTTDAYRLGRWARVRVDVGGFYFHLLAAVAFIALAELLGQPWLAFVTFAINVEVLRQLTLPFIRLDGYWLLADLMGIPDPFSQTRPFLRSLLPGSRPKGTKLPRLRPWAKAAFASYVAVTVPTLCFLLYKAVTKLPDLWSTAWDSFELHKAALTTAFESGDVMRAITSSLEVFITAMPALATGLMVVLLVSWAARNIARRLALPPGSLTPERTETRS